MHYEIDYKTLPDSDAIRKACIDALDWLEAKRYKILVRVIKSGDYDKDQVHFLAGIAGFEGFPVTAMWKRYHNE